MRRRVEAPDGRDWIVQLVWWPRPTQAAVTSDAAAGTAGVPQAPLMKNAVPRTYSGWGPVAGVIFDAIVIFVWPLVLGLRILFHRPWLIAAFPPKGEFKGAAWKVRGLGPAREAVRAIADGIRAGNRDPAPAAAEATRFRVKLRAPGLGL